MKRVAIIGGGVAGLSAAFYLQKKARAAGHPVAITLFEAAPRLGGKLLTRRPEGFVVEGGPDSFINQKPQGLQLCRDAGLGDELLPSNDATYKTRLLRNGRLLPFPEGFRLAVPTRIWPFVRSPLISPLGKLRMGLDLVIPRRRSTADESLADFITRRLGREALAPLPLLLERLVEIVRVLHAVDVAPRAGVSIPVPGTTDPGTGFENA